jgi:hypothetical protein
LHSERFSRLSFADCGRLSLIWIPSCIAVLCSSCFRSCPFLRHVIFEIPSKLQQIESKVFFSCVSLRSICVPNRVDFLGSFSFYSCHSLLEVIFEQPSKLCRI